MPTLIAEPIVFNIFPPYIFFNSILLPPANDTFAFARNVQANPSAKIKEPFLPTPHRTMSIQ